jgi:hypothetical protein
MLGSTNHTNILFVSFGSLAIFPRTRWKGTPFFLHVTAQHMQVHRRSKILTQK